MWANLRSEFPQESSCKVFFLPSSFFILLPDLEHHCSTPTNDWRRKLHYGTDWVELQFGSATGHRIRSPRLTPEEIEDIWIWALSIMPEGFEKLPAEDLFSLLDFLKGK
jgi:hypothetical protein